MNSEAKTTNLKTTLDYALYYVNELGFSVIPVRYRDKIPAIKSWKEFQQRKPNNDELNRWFHSSYINIGIVTGSTSNLTVIDLDSKKAVNYAKENKFPKTPLVKTGRGYHLYYKYSQGMRNVQKNASLPDIDLRSEGGYTVAPPSIHKSGYQYLWIKNKSIDEIPLAELPALIKQKAYTESNNVCVNRGIKKNNIHTSFYLTSQIRNIPILSIAQCLGIVVNNHNKAESFNGHDNQTPSLSFEPQDNYFYCFGCGITGSPIDLVMQYLNLNFREALSWILINH